MTGYQEILTDPSYAGQIVTMTYPHIGNYGVNPEDEESNRPHVKSFVMPRLLSPPEQQSRHPQPHRVPGMPQRHRHRRDRHPASSRRRVRIHGVMNAAVSTEDLDPDSLVGKARDWAGLEGVDLVREVTCDEAVMTRRRTTRGFASWPMISVSSGISSASSSRPAAPSPSCRRRTTAAEALAMDADGFFLSNGPGDPATRSLRHRHKPASWPRRVNPSSASASGTKSSASRSGAEIFHLKFGHRGANHPIKETESGRVLITSENHGWGIRSESLPDELEITRLNLNDGCVEGMRHRTAAHLLDPVSSGRVPWSARQLPSFRALRRSDGAAQELVRASQGRLVN